MNNDADKSLINDKAELRKVAQAMRARIHAAHASEGRRLLARRAGDIINQCELNSGAVIAGYHPIKDEIDCLGLLSDFRSAGCEIVLPRMRGHGRILDFHGWDGEAALVTGAYGVMEPSADCPLVIPQVVLLPLLAFDLNGGRLGYGGGYYDRTLEALRGHGEVVAVGAGYDEQEVANVPRDALDQRLDYIATPTRLIKALGEAV